MNFINGRENYKKHTYIAFFGFLSELPNFILSILACAFSNAIIVWVDTMSSFESTLHYFIVFLLALKLRKDQTKKYNYGIKRLETFFSFICDLLLLVTISCLIGVSIYGIVHPSKPADNMMYFLILKLFNISFDIFFLIQTKTLAKKHPSRLNDTETAKCRIALLSDIIVGVCSLICFLLRNVTWSWYLSPIFSIILCIYFLFGSFKRLKNSIFEIIDHAIKKNQEEEIRNFISTLNIPYIKECKFHKLGKNIYVDFYLSFGDPLSMQLEIENFKKEYLTKYPDHNVDFHI